MNQPTCDICGDPTDGYCCRRCCDETARYLRHVVDLAAEVETNVARLARYASRGGRRAADPYPDHTPDLPTPQTRPETFAWAASREQPERNALRPEPLPVDLNASARAAVAFNHVTTWARTVEDDRGILVPDVRPGGHPAAVAARYLLEQLSWMRQQRFAAEAFDQLKAAGSVIQRIVDRPPDEEIVGRCECQAYLYAYKGATTVTCPNAECRLRWDVETSRRKLWDALPGYLMTASEAALLLMLHGIGRYDRRRWAKTIVMWGQRGLITAHGEIDGAPVYLFGDIRERATRSQDVPAV
jgi:hypothetical protein